MGRAKSKEFAELLTEGIYTIRLRESKNMAIVEDEIGYAIGRVGGTSITHWRRGNIPAKQSDLEKLAQEIIRRSNLGASWLEAFLGAAGYPGPEQFIKKLFFSEPSNFTQSTANHPLRPRLIQVVGRDSLIDQIMTLLESQDRYWIVSLDGMGGIGKTALASGVAKKCLDENLFDTVVWINGLEREYPDVNQDGVRILTFEQVLNAIISQLSNDELPRLTETDKEKRVQSLLHSQRVLVVVDNLEVAGKFQKKIAQRLLPFLSPSKALLISRQRFTGDLYAIRLIGLDDKDIRQFMSQEADLRGINRIKAIKEEELQHIIISTGGSPLALKLVVGQLAELPLEAVLSHLSAVRPLKTILEEDEYINFYKFIFWSSWEILSHDSKGLLIAMAHFAPGIGGMFDMIGEISNLRNDKLIRSIDQLWNLSFLEVGESLSLQRIRYYLHALTQHFVLSDIVQETKPSEE